MMSEYCENCYKLAEENTKLKEKLEKILNFCKTLEDVKEEYMRIQLIKEIIEDKKDIHYYLEQNEMQKFIPNVAEIRGVENDKTM